MRGAARCTDRDDHDVSCGAKATPLHLNPPEVVTNLEREIGPAVLGDRLQHRDAELGSSEHDRLLGDGALVVGVQHEHMFA
jgi:hypothetical protein